MVKSGKILKLEPMGRFLDRLDAVKEKEGHQTCIKDFLV